VLSDLRADLLRLAPGVQAFGPITMGDGSSAGANSVAGVPARPIGRRTEAIPLRDAA